MTYEEFFERVSSLLAPLQFSTEDGEEYREPALDVMRYQVRRVRLHWIPVLGQALGVVAIVRQPSDLESDSASYKQLQWRVSRAVHGRFPPWPAGGPGLAIGLTTIVLTADPIGPQDEQFLATALPDERRSRVVPLGLLRVNLEQEALSFVLHPAPQEFFPEPMTLADGLSEILGRFMPPLDLD